MILIVVGLAPAVFASRRAVTHASALRFGLRIPPFLVEDRADPPGDLRPFLRCAPGV